MNLIIRPQVGHWYKTPTGEIFEIVAGDEEEGTIELQYYDGAIEELDIETWHSIMPEKIEPPEDWRGSMDVARDALDDQETSPDNSDVLSRLEGL